MPDLGDGRDDLPGYPDTVAGLVPRCVVDDHPEERRQRVGTTTRARIELARFASVEIDRRDTPHCFWEPLSWIFD
jgi:hypothetical protein